MIKILNKIFKHSVVGKNINRNADIIRRSEYFDADWYKNKYLDLEGKKIDLAQHYLEYGSDEGRNPGPNFQTAYYLRRYSDVAEESMNPLLHFILHGEAEGRKPKIDFDEDFYLKLYPHLVNHSLTPIQHYIFIGLDEGRLGYFDSNWYLGEYLDINFSIIKPKDHFVLYGQYEGRHPYFDEDWYVSQYQDSTLGTTKAIEHYHAIGLKEGRHAAFDRNFYLSQNPEINAAGLNPLHHYINHGKSEGRYPAFNRAWYLKAYRDVKKGNLDPYKHYISFGKKQGRPLSPSSLSKLSSFGEPNIWLDQNVATSLDGCVPEISDSFTPKVSVIVPNFNHAKYLNERLESIYGQTYKNFEVILLDDCSKDQSAKILTQFASVHKHNTVIEINKKNSGGVFNQWKKGLSLAKGDLIWIAESDDYCSLDFLSELVRFFRNNAVMLAFCRTDFIQSETRQKVWTSEEYWHEAQIKLSAYSFIKTSHEIVEEAWSFRNIAPNVSGALFRRPSDLAILDDPEWLKLRMCGDWIFYLSIIRGGLVGYTSSTTNFYRQHSENTSINTHNKDIYYKEHAVVASYLLRMYNVSDRALQKNETVLYRHWCLKRGNNMRAEFKDLFDFDTISSNRSFRRKNIAIAAYAMVSGGGETFPILIANLLYRNGYAVTFVNFEKEPTKLGIKSTLNRSIPILELENSCDIGETLTRMGIELVHSHHAWVDITLAFFLDKYTEIARIVTMHGMYELLDENDINNHAHRLSQTDEWVYIADKNIMNSTQAFLDRSKNLTKISNSVELKSLSGLTRKDIGLKEKDFVVCIASRAVPEKGWQEAVSAVTWANKNSNRAIQLIMVGDGPEYERLKKSELPSFIHLLGFQINVRDFFNVADVGLITSKFRGESCPLVLIECLSVGKPVIASDIGEVSSMLTTKAGMAGRIHKLEKWSIDVEEVGRIILNLSDRSSDYSDLTSQVPEAFAKFDHDIMLDNYIKVYERAIDKRHTPEGRLELSVVLVAYNMSRELKRTLHTLSSDYQKLSLSDFEIIIIDNGSSCSYDIEDIINNYPNAYMSSMVNPSKSPIDALAHGISISRGEIICAFIDAARMTSPNLLKLGIMACKSGDRVFAGALSYHIGHEPQNISVGKGYNQILEDSLMESVQWEKDGYELFKICSYDPSSRFGFCSCPAETNSLFMHKSAWSECGGFDSAFSGAGGGLANLDLWKRLCDNKSYRLVMLLGEGTFHQFHGGVTTNSPVDNWTDLHDEYVEIRGHPYKIPNIVPIQLGIPDSRAMAFFNRNG